MKKAVYFFQYLPPWRIDVFNGMARQYDLTVVFFNAELEGFTYDRKDLLSRLHGMDIRFLNTGFNVGTRPVRTGITALLKELRPEVVFVHEYSQVSVTLALCKRFFGYRLYVTTSDNLMMARASSGPKAWARRFVLRHAEGVIVYSHGVEAFYRAHFPWLRTGICPNIQDPSTILFYRKDFTDPLPGGQRVILFVGRLVELKKLDLLMEAFASVPHAGYTLALVGEGEERESLERRAESLGIRGEVHFAGFQFGASLYRWYDRADFFVLPSRYEPFGAVVNESLVLGCPVLVSRYIGALEFVEGTDGIVFDSLDPADFRRALAEAMMRFPAAAGPRPSLMRVSFEEAVRTFTTIDDDTV